MKTLWNREPALVLSVISAFISLAISFGLDLTTDQVGAIMAVCAALIGFAIRSQVTPVQRNGNSGPERRTAI